MDPTPQKSRYNGWTYDYYDIPGEKDDEAVFFLHGIGVNKDWAKNRVHMIDTPLRKIIPELPGHGGVPFDDIRSLDDIAKYLSGLASTLELKHYSVVGFSLGALVSMKWAEVSRNDERLRGVVAWAGPVLGLSGIGTEGRFIISMIKSAPKPVYNLGTRVNLMRVASRSYGVHLPEDELKALAVFPQDSAQRIVEMFVDEPYDLNPEIPTLMIYGTGDILATEKNYDYVKRRCGENLEVELVKQGGHFGDDPGTTESYKKISKFLRKLEK